jgi:hypothetical protein
VAVPEREQIAQMVIHPVITSDPLLVWQCKRNGLAGIGVMEKQPIWSTGVVVVAPA